MLSISHDLPPRTKVSLGWASPNMADTHDQFPMSTSRLEYITVLDKLQPAAPDGALHALDPPDSTTLYAAHLQVNTGIRYG
jgi:hypothetical protein